MSTAVHTHPVPHVVNRLWGFLIRRGAAPASMVLLTVVGRKSGQPHTTVVALVTQDGDQYLVAPYGETNWLKNARAAGQVSIRHGSQAWTARLEELPPHESAPVLKQYLAEHLVTRPYFAVGADGPVAAFEQEAALHPVFRLHRV